MQTNEILETIKMIDEEYLDIRTITMGISLLDCMDPDIHVCTGNCACTGTGGSDSAAT